MKRVFLVLVFFTLVSGCIKVVDMDVGDLPDELVVNCFFTEGDPFVVNVSRLAEYPDLSDRNIADATVLIFENNSLLGQLNHSVNGIYSNTSVSPKSGKVYKIEVKTTGFPKVTATDSLPQKVEIDNCSNRLEAGIDEEGDYYQELNVSFSDIPNIDYYSIQVYKKTISNIYDEKLDAWKDVLIWYPVELFSRDPVIVAEGITKEDYSEYFVFNDVLFKNILYPLKVNAYFGTNDVLRVVLETGTKNYYLYRKQLIKHEPYTYQSPFKPYDPVSLYSNIENGLGIFAGYQRDIYELTIIQN